ncbi:hypothetical protein ACPPVT_14110 [Angustibacter sp. McL0619]|uniref:hypothetical protein n=1 Tax=Angustibacter sp. McL0619 TaxID=3415676 RepID=UPI003CF1C4D7
MRLRTFAALVLLTFLGLWLPALPRADALPPYYWTTALYPPRATSGPLGEAIDIRASWSCLYPQIGRVGGTTTRPPDVGTVTFKAVHQNGSVTTESFAGVSADTRVKWSYPGVVAGEDTISASVKPTAGWCVGEHGTPSGPFHYTWNVAPTLTLAPSGTTTEVNHDFTVTATFHPGSNGGSANGENVSFTASGPGGSMGSGPVHVAGNQARWTFSRAGPGTDTISATVTQKGGDGLPASPITHSWRAPVLSLTLSPPTATSEVGATALVTATLRRDGLAVDGVHVQFDVAASGSGPAKSGSRHTNSSGSATYGWSRALPGIDHVTVTATYLGQHLTDSARHSWTKAVQTGDLTITLAPAGVATPVDEPFTATAKVTLDGVAFSGATVHFVASQPGGATKTADPLLAAGAAGFTFTRPTAGDETITATVTEAGHHGSVSIPHTWTSEGGGGSTPPGRLGGSSSPPGGTTTVTGDGCAPAAAVTLHVGDAEVGLATAADDGTFHAVVQAPQLPLGRYTVTATCGDLTAEGTLDLVGLTSATGTAAAASVTSAAILTFVALLVFSLLRVPGWGQDLAGRPRRDDPSGG